MKKLLKNTIKLKGIGQTKNIFDNLDENGDYFYLSLVEIQGRKLKVEFSYDDDGQTINNKVFVKLIYSENEIDIKNDIISQLENILLF